MAPGDGDEDCINRLRYDKGTKMLMDSRQYLQLLGVDGAVWDQRDFDDNNPPFSLNPTYVSNTL